MPVLMDKTDWTATFESAKRSNRVWHQRVMGRGGENLISLPESGSFEVIFVAVSPVEEKRRKVSAKDMIGFGKRFHAPRPTEEWMKELREGED
jgi:hypothetical protein